MELQESFVVVTDWLVILAVAILLVAVYGSWLVSYRTPKVASVGANLWFSLPPWAQIAAGFAISIVGAYISYLLWTPLPFTVSSGMFLFLRIVGLVIISSGVILWFWARRMLGPMMGVSTASAAQLNVDHRLVQNGAYAIVRHPMYLGYWLLLAGLIIIYRTWMPLVVLILMIASLSRRARREDQALEANFGEEWRTYAERVPMFIPYKKQPTV